MHDLYWLTQWWRRVCVAQKWRLCISVLVFVWFGGLHLNMRVCLRVHVWAILGEEGVCLGFEWALLKVCVCVLMWGSPDRIVSGSVHVYICILLLAGRTYAVQNRCFDRQTCKWLSSPASHKTHAVNSVHHASTAGKAFAKCETHAQNTLNNSSDVTVFSCVWQQSSSSRQPIRSEQEQEVRWEMLTSPFMCWKGINNCHDDSVIDVNAPQIIRNLNLKICFIFNDVEWWIKGVKIGKTTQELMLSRMH